MGADLPADLWKRLTGTVGLVVARRDAELVNVMAAEWAYFVNRTPLYAAVALGPQAVTRDLIAQTGGYSLTLCAQDQAELADFVGSFSLADVDKTTSELLDLGAPAVTDTPWVRGGVVALECELRHVLALPVHRLFVAEVVAAHLPTTPARPLVKHGPMHGLGPALRAGRVVVGVRRDPAGVLTVAATGPPGTGGPWHVTLLPDTAGEIPLGSHPSTVYGDLQVRIPLPPSVPLDDARVRVERDGAHPGFARLAPHRGPRTPPPAPA
ncbi:flavin reductase family protein [Streptomyces heilongjiangensis]|uniref:Flavin reductase family protein n=1 Tax=Streptomyces heilongjiangensis TaxID=945052 RepID=A0ABW1B9L8_9ACTN|nr:flavin reductase [Streptomyces heilongjiangensis]MDC2947235.1 flavin reductase [Streptomyces heilongjiangensis]